MKYLATQVSKSRTFEVTKEQKEAIEKNPQFKWKYTFVEIAPKGKAPIEIKEIKSKQKGQE